MFGNARFASVLLCALSFLTFAGAVLVQGQYRASMWGSDNWQQLPGAVSFAEHRVPLGLIDEGVHRAFNMTEADPSLLIAALQRSRSPDAKSGQLDIARDGIGVSYLLFASLSMKAFGVRLDAMAVGLLVLMGLSTAAFVVRFKDDSALIIIPFSFLALTITLCAPVITETYTRYGAPIGGTRTMALMGLIPALHLVYAARARPSPANARRNAILFGLQATILSLAILIRASAAYFVLAIGLVMVLALWHRRSEAKPWRMPLKQLAALALMMALVVGTVVAVAPREYVESGRLTGNFWHRAFIGLSLGGDWPFSGLRAMFPCESEALPNGIGYRFDNVGFCAWFAAHHLRPSLSEFNQHFHHFFDGEYENVLRKAFFAVLMAYPREVFDIMTRVKTAMLATMLGEAMDFSKNDPVLFIRAAPFAVLEIVFFSTFLSLAGSLKELARVGGIFALFFLVSLIPLYVVYPVLYVAVDTAFYMYAVMLAAAAALMAIIPKIAAGAFRHLAPTRRRREGA